ncbi:hypothetical protein AADZ90_006970 [Aestuariibius sp. 2305UL40-4]
MIDDVASISRAMLVTPLAMRGGLIAAIVMLSTLAVMGSSGSRRTG